MRSRTFSYCSHLANTIAIRHVAVGAECRFCLDLALVLTGCCGQDFVDYNLYLPLSFSFISAVSCAGSFSRFANNFYHTASPMVRIPCLIFHAPLFTQ